MEENVSTILTGKKSEINLSVHKNTIQLDLVDYSGKITEVVSTWMKPEVARTLATYLLTLANKAEE